MSKEKKIDLLLINPSLDFENDMGYLRGLRVDADIPRQQSPFIGVGYLLAVAKRKGLSVKFIDMVAYGVSLKEILNVIKETRPVLVGLRAFTVQVKAAGFIAKEIRKNFPDILICIGGPHASASPEKTLEEFNAFDFVICGDGELVLSEAVGNIKQGKPVSDLKGVITKEGGKSDFDEIGNLDDLPFPAWEEFELDKYPGADPHRTKRELPVSTSRGCPFSCIFCFRPFGNRRRSRTTDSVIEEIEYDIKAFGCEAVYFCDETFTADLKWSNELFKKMIQKGIHKKIKWSCETRVDVASFDLFRLMKEAGCYYIFFGFESADDHVLKTARKGFKAPQIKKVISAAKEAGIVCAGSFILGLPGETEESIKRTIDYSRELGVYSVTFPIAVPFPGTALRAMAEKGCYGLRIISDNWDNYGKQHPGVMESRRLGINRLRDFQREAYERNPKKACF